ncbi:B3 domain-containing protein Os04g0386900-like [Phalaenopsis equestris]|uniref:B3 domain-containing protein Os04g0386900-like n=1 Tax=Phalaenopsis equestris TaxID=78828 RepID=UPI0009E3CE4E|nr:B3 domain-containing protein Os04g0386900-like [Phalaenopsis equestris]
MHGALSSYSKEEVCGLVGSSHKKNGGCAGSQKEPGCKESNKLSGHAEPIPNHKIHQLEGKPYFTAIMGTASVCRSFLVKIPKSFSEFLPSSSAWIILCCREKEWAAKCRVSQSAKFINEGWKQFVLDNNLKIGDGCVFELMNIKELRFRVQILSGELPVSPTTDIFTRGNSIDTPILIG